MDNNNNNNENQSDTLQRCVTPEPQVAPRRVYCDSLCNDSTGNAEPSDCQAPLKTLRKMTPKRKFEKLII